MTEKLITVIMGQDCERFIEMALESVKDSDVVIYCDGGSNFRFWEDTEYDGEFVHNLWKDVIVIENRYNQEDKLMNGKQRNFYLEYVKKHYPNDWCLVIDADEVTEDLSKIKEFINDSKTPKGLYSVHMRHFQQDLGHEDATQKMHFVPNRLFKISEAGQYPLGEHPVLQGKDEGINNLRTVCTTIWHLAYIPNLWEIKKRYDNHMKKSEIHTPEFLKQWYYAHLFGQYPSNPITLTDIPEIILRNFGIDKDELYFANRGLEVKHFLMAKQFMDFFNPESCVEYGCGKAPFGYAIQSYGYPYNGIELSNYAVANAFVPIKQGNIIEHNEYAGTCELCLCIDVLEHLNDDELDKALTQISKWHSKFLFSIPFEGDPNLYKDKTHKQFHSKEEWIKIFNKYGIEISDAPKDWLYSQQLLTGKIK